MAAKPASLPPWFCSPCVPAWSSSPSSFAQRQQQQQQQQKRSPPSALRQWCGCICLEAARLPFTEFDSGNDVPFLPSSLSSEPTDLLGPPAPPSSETFSHAFGIHSPCCQGRFLVAGVFGPDRMLWVTLLLLVVPISLFAVFAAADVKREFGAWALVLIFTAALSAFVFLALTYLTEPGILPTLSFHEGEEEVASHVYVYVDGRYFDRRVFRAQKSRFTASMLEGFDHYCPWVSNAIAKRNYRYFFFFLSSCFTLSALTSATCVAVLIKRAPHHGGWKILEKEPALWLIAAYAFVFAASLSSLLVYHVRITSRGLSTSEDVKNRFAKGNPYGMGCSNHWALVCCGPHWPSRVGGNCVAGSNGKTSLVASSNEDLEAGGRGSGNGGEIVSSEQQHDLTALLLSPSSPAASRPVESVEVLDLEAS